MANGNYNQRLNGFNPLAYLGINSFQPPDFYTVDTDPTVNDVKNFYLGALWLNTTNLNVWMLVRVVDNLATWELLSGGAGSIITLTGNTGGPVMADMGNINVVGDGTTVEVTGDPGTHTLTISATGAIAGEYVTDAGTAVPAGGVLDVNGAHNINTSGSGHQVVIHGNNTITVGDLVNVTGTPSITMTTGDLTITAGNINLTDSNSAGTIGYIKMGNNRFLSIGPSAPTALNLFLGLLAGNTTLTGNANICIGGLAGSDLTSGANNVMMGNGAGSDLTTGSQNTLIGTSAGLDLTTGSYNTLVGVSSAGGLLTGSYNLCLDGGSNYAGAESSNILLSNAGVLGESNVMRLGTTGSGNGQVSTTYIAGVAGVTITPSNKNIVTIDVTTGQLGSEASSSDVEVVPYTYVDNADSPYTALATDYYISCDVTGGAITVDLFNAPATGRVFIIKDKVGLAATSNITITTPGGTVLFDGATSYVINTNYQSVNLLFDGTNYQIF